MYILSLILRPTLSLSPTLLSLSHTLSNFQSSLWWAFLSIFTVLRLSLIFVLDCLSIGVGWFVPVTVLLVSSSQGWVKILGHVRRAGAAAPTYGVRRHGVRDGVTAAGAEIPPVLSAPSPHSPGWLCCSLPCGLGPQAPRLPWCGSESLCAGVRKSEKPLTAQSDGSRRQFLMPCWPPTERWARGFSLLPAQGAVPPLGHTALCPSVPYLPRRLPAGLQGKS